MAVPVDGPTADLAPLGHSPDLLFHLSLQPGTLGIVREQSQHLHPSSGATTWILFEPQQGHGLSSVIPRTSCSMPLSLLLSCSPWARGTRTRRTRWTTGRLNVAHCSASSRRRGRGGDELFPFWKRLGRSFVHPPIFHTHDHPTVQAGVLVGPQLPPVGGACLGVGCELRPPAPVASESPHAVMGAISV